VENKIGDLLSRIAALEARFDTRPGDVKEQRRRYELILYVILPLLGSILSSFQQAQGHREQLRSLYESPELQRAADENVLGLLEDLRETISGYQVRSSPWHRSRC
jgi:hypothetical protein